MDNVELTNLAHALGDALKARGFMLATAESCTGGLVSAAMTEIAGSSAWFERGFVTYSNAAKMELLGVKAETLEKFGAVSEQTALEMVQGALKNSQAHIALSITGIAGPDGGTPQKPVGTVCFAWAAQGCETRVETHQFSGNRTQIRQAALSTALAGALKMLHAV